VSTTAGPPQYQNANNSMNAKNGKDASNSTDNNKRRDTINGGNSKHKEAFKNNRTPAKRIEYKEATLRFGRRRLLIFEAFLDLHRKSEGEEGDTGLCLWQPSYLPES
jgi:hypothetical protein